MDRRGHMANASAGHEGEGSTETLCSCTQLWVQLCRGGTTSSPMPALTSAQASMPKMTSKQREQKLSSA